MAAEIINFPFQGQNDRCLVLSNGQWAATGIGTSWKRLWIGIRYCTEDTGQEFPTTGSRFFIGVMSNPVNDADGKISNGFPSISPSHMAGLYHVSGALWNWDTKPLGEIMEYYFLIRGIMKVGTSYSESSQTTSTNLYGSNQFGAKRYVFVLELLKSQTGGVYNLSITHITGSWHDDYPRGNLTLQNLLSAMRASNLNSAASSLNQAEGTSSAYGARSSLLVSVNENTNGPLNAIHIYWGHTIPRIAISDVCYAIKE